MCKLIPVFLISPDKIMEMCVNVLALQEKTKCAKSQLSKVKAPTLLGFWFGFEMLFVLGPAVFPKLPSDISHSLKLNNQDLKIIRF